MKNHYQILGVPTNCSQADVKKAYRQLALKYHPDKNSGDMQSEEQFKEILESYIILSDAETRSEYDYIKGLKTSYRVLGAEPGKLSPIKFLIKFRKIKETVFNANGRINKTSLFKVIDELLSDTNLNFLIKEKDISINYLIIDEVITCCIFLEDPGKSIIQSKLVRLSDGNSRMLKRIEFLSNVNSDAPMEDNKIAQTSEVAPSITTILIFIVFLLLFILLLFIQYNKS